ncbi:MAG: VCBS repeat-containing protein, partial [bacterium]|nr:VCBS repeat-containing protein [bacterium]
MNSLLKSIGFCAGISLCLSACGKGGESSGAGAQDAHEPAIADGAIQFRDEALERGIDFVHVANRTSERWIPEVMGAGVAVADFNRDGAPDLYLVGGGSIDQAQRPVAARDRLFLNDGRGRFKDVSQSWNVEGVDFGMGVACGDYDNDGWTDLLLTGFGGGERLLRNTGDGFEDVTLGAGLNPGDTWGMSAGFFDADGDGDLDIYVVRYVEFDLGTATRCWSHGRPIICSP